MWILWALLSAIFAAARRPFEKQTVKNIHHFSYGFLTQCLSLPVVAGAMLLAGKMLNPFHLGVRFWVPALVSGVAFYPVNVYLYRRAIKDGELSKVLPLQSLSPVFALLLAWLTIGEVPTAIASVGICCTVAAIYALGLKGKRLHHPLQPFREDGSSRAMFALVCLVSVVSLLDKIAIRASNPLFYSFTSTILAIATLCVAARLCKQNVIADLRQSIKKVGVIGTLQGGTFTTYNLAIGAGPIAYVSALRSSNILMGAILGIVVFHEKLTKAKLISFALIVVGSLLLTFGA